MIPKRYQLTYTETSHVKLNRLVDAGYNIRDVLNAGIILFYKASLEDRGKAHMEAYNQLKVELKEAIESIQQIAKTVNYEILDKADAEMLNRLREVLGGDPEQSAAAAAEAAQNAERAAKARPGKHGHRTA
jgi:hypothetical protein